MPLPSLRRKISPLLLVALVAVPAASSAVPRREARPRTAAAAPAPFALLERLWNTLTSLWAEEGCRLDPDGRCVPNQGSGLTVPTNTGCQSDPDGCSAVQVASPAEG